MLKHCGISPESNKDLTNLRLFCCFTCKIQNVTFFHCGLVALNVVGNSYLHNIKIIQFSQKEIIFKLEYIAICQSQNNYSNYIHTITINQIFIHEYTNFILAFDYTKYNLKIYLQNLCFYNNRRSLRIKGRYYTIKEIFFTNCTFKDGSVIESSISPFNGNMMFINCKFYNKHHHDMIKIHIEICKYRSIECELFINNETFPMIPTNISFVECQFINNKHRVLFIENRAPALGKVNILFKSLNISHNNLLKTKTKDIILLINANIYIAGTFTVTNNKCDLSIMHFQSCNILFSGKVTFGKNFCSQVIKLDTYIKIMEHTAITFKDNIYHNNVISIKQNAEEYHQPYPFCFIQYVTINNNVKPEDY